MTIAARAAGSPPASQRMRSLAIVALCVVAQVSSLAHMLLVQHEACPEHGEITHVGEDASVAHRRIHAQESRSAAIAENSTRSEDHGHDHCAAIGHRREQVLPAFFGALVVQATERIAAHVPPNTVPRVSSVALYLIAPKSSPPA